MGSGGSRVLADPLGSMRKAVGGASSCSSREVLAFGFRVHGLEFRCQNLDGVGRRVLEGVALVDVDAEPGSGLRV